MSRVPVRRSVAALWVAALLAVWGAVPSSGQTGDVPSVDVRPSDTRPTDPNGGQWFFFELTPGSTGRGRARIANPAEVPQTIKLYFRDLAFNESGTPDIRDDEAQVGVGAWGAFGEAEATIPAKGVIEVPFTVTLPTNPAPEPGDHVGVLVAESAPTMGGQVGLIKRVATRLYVTVPGEAVRAFEIEFVRSEKDSFWWPRSSLETITLRNTGRIKISPVVTAKGVRAAGPDSMLTQSVEKYLADVSIPWYGGPVKIPIEAVAEGGIVRRTQVSMFVIPWGLIVLLVFLAFVAYMVRRWWRKRRQSRDSLQADIRRLEQLITQRPTGPIAVEPAATAGDQEVAELDAILAALKRARRTKSQLSVERLALALHEASGDALDELLEALENIGPERRRDLIQVAGSYGPEAVIAHRRTNSLADDVREELFAEFAPAETESAPPPEAPAPRATKKAPAPSPRPRRGNRN